MSWYPEVVEQLVSKANVHPQHEPIAQDSGMKPCAEEIDPELLETDEDEDLESPQAGTGSKSSGVVGCCRTSPNP